MAPAAAPPAAPLVAMAAGRPPRRPPRPLPPAAHLSRRLRPPLLAPGAGTRRGAGTGGSGGTCGSPGPRRQGRPGPWRGAAVPARRGPRQRARRWGWRRAAAREARRGGAGARFLPLRWRGRRRGGTTDGGPPLRRLPAGSGGEGAAGSGSAGAAEAPSEPDRRVGREPPGVSAARGRDLGNRGGTPCVFRDPKERPRSLLPQPPSCSSRSCE